MKSRNIGHVCTVCFMTLIVSLIACGVSAQTAMKPTIKISGDTILAKKKISSFHVEVTQERDEEVFVLSISNPFGEKLRINISSLEGVGFTDNTKAFGYQKRINMSGAQDGDYMLTVTGDKKTFTKNIRLQTEIVQTRNISIK